MSKSDSRLIAAWMQEIAQRMMRLAARSGR